MGVEAGGDEEEIGVELPEHRQDDLGEDEAVVLVDRADLERDVHRKSAPGPRPISLAAPVPG